MASESISKYVIEIGGDAGDLEKVFSGIKSRIRSDVGEIKALTDKVTLFGDIESSIPQVQRALDTAKQKVTQLRAEIDKIDGKAPKELTDSLAAAEKASASATKELARQQAQLAALDNQLTRAGVSTKNLAAEQQRLAQASKAAADAATVTAAKQQLGLVTLADTQKQATQLRAAFDTLKNSGVLSASETTAAQAQLNAKLKELFGTVTTTGTALNSTMGKAKESIVGLVAPTLTATAALAAVVTAIQDIAATGKAYESGLKSITIETTATSAQTAALAGEIRALAQAMGLDLNESIKSVKELLRGGIAPTEVIDALRVSAVAAKAAMVDLGVGIKATQVLTSAFGVPVKELGAALDVLNVAARNGGPTLTEFANGASNLGVVARAVNASFTEVTAALTIMTNATGDAAGSADALQKILVNLNRDDVQKSLRELGIEGRGVADTFAKLNERGLNINEFLNLGVANTKAAVAVGALKENAKDLPRIMGEFSTAAGTTAAIVEKSYDSARERVERFSAAVNELKIRIGLSGDGLGVLAQNATLLVDTFARVGAALSENPLSLLLIGPISQVVLKFQEAKQAAEEARAAFIKWGDGASDQVSRVADRITAAKALITELLADNEADRQKALAQLRTDSAELVKLIEQSRALGADILAEITKRSTAEIDAIQRTTDARKAALLAATEDIRAFGEIRDADTQAAATAAINAQTVLRELVAKSEEQILAIRIKAANDQLAVIKANEAEVSAAITAALKARIAEAGDNQIKKKAIEEEFGRLQVDNTKKALELYRGHYDSLVQLNRTYVDKIKSIDAERVSFNATIANAIREVLNRSLEGIDLYRAKILQTEDLIGRAQAARLNGNRELEQRYTNEAISNALQLGQVVDKTGKVVITQQQAQSDALKLLDRVSDQYNESLSEQEGAAKKGARATQEGLAAVKSVIDQVQIKLDGVLKSVASGITLKINEDIQGLSDAERKLNQLARDRTVLLRVQQTGGSGSGGSGPLLFQWPDGSWQGTPPPPSNFTGFNRGGPVGQFMQAYAAGGPVFRKPNWSKVPGTGNQDTVPAALQAGSFVMRKAAVQKYGDGAMMQLAKAYANGGPVQRFAGGGAVDIDLGTAEDSALAVISYATAILPYLRHPIFQQTVRDMGTLIRAIQAGGGRNKGDIRSLLGISESAALNVQVGDAWGHSFSPIFTTKRLRSFAEFLKTFKPTTVGKKKSMLSDLIAAATGATGATRATPPWSEFAAGGAARGTDTVAAMLTPGEFVIPKPVVDKVGVGWLNALNSMRVPAPPRPKYFAAGGMVGDVPPSSSGRAATGGDIQIHIHGIGTDFSDPAVQRRAAAGIREQLRREGVILPTR